MRGAAIFFIIIVVERSNPGHCKITNNILSV